MASNTITRLHQGQLAATAADLGSAGAASGTMVKQINLTNTAGTSEVVELFIGSSGTSADADLVFKVTLSGGDYAVFDGLMVIPSGSFLVGQSTNATAVTVTVHGMEMV